MQMRLGYFYAEVDDATGLCIGFLRSSNPNLAGPTATDSGTTFVPVPVDDDEYFLKYYINGSWWEDAEATIPWESSLL